MSGKPTKKSDMGKAWMKPRRDFRQMIAPEYHLIVTEGTETEPQYFGAMKTVIDQKYRDRIHLDITGKGDNTLSLFARAVQDVSKSNNVYKHVWLVFDKDDFPAEQFDRTVAQSCNTLEIKRGRALLAPPSKHRTIVGLQSDPGGRPTAYLTANTGCPLTAISPSIGISK